MSRISEGVHAVAELLAHARSSVGDGSAPLEVEVRLGSLGADGRFSAGVPHASFMSVLLLLEAFPRWLKVEPWVETHDVYYSAPLRGTPSMIRTSTGGGESSRTSVHVVKERLGHVDLVLQGGQGFDMRASASLEHPVPASCLPVAVVPSHVRVKTRKRFFLSSRGVSGAAFVFDLSIVFNGRTRSEAEAKQRAGAAVYEVEVECLDVNGYLESCEDDVSLLALSLVSKALDFSKALGSDEELGYVPA